jgi:transcriptional regulator with XRE-family HTH domain
MGSKIFAEMLANVKPETTQYVQKNIAIAFQVREILERHPTINSQKALADALGKEPSEISKWLSGLHNLSLESITKMETVLGQDIILTLEQAEERYAGFSIMQYQPFQTIEHIQADRANREAALNKKKTIQLSLLSAIKQKLRTEIEEPELAY